MIDSTKVRFMIMDMELLTTEEVAKTLHLTKRGVGRLFKSGELKTAKVGNAYLTPREEIDAFIRGRIKKTSEA